MAFDTGLGSPSLDDFSLDLTSKEVGTDLGGAEQNWGRTVLHHISLIYVLGIRQMPGAYKV